MIALGLVMWACGGDSASKVASAIKDGSALTPDDYTVMIDYCGKYATEAQKLQDRINTLAPTSGEAAKLTDELAALSGKYPYLNEFFAKIPSCSKEEIGEKNVDKINSLAPMTWFSAPDWADASDNADVVGSIVDMPSSDTAGVIAVGDGEAVDSVPSK